jgi:hypothetical protein
VAGAPTDRRSGAVARLLIGGQRSLEGERAVVEQSRSDALSREPESVNPRVCVDERWCSGSPSQTPTGSNPVTAGLGKPWGAASFARVLDRGCF